MTDHDKHPDRREDHATPEGAGTSGAVTGGAIGAAGGAAIGGPVGAIIGGVAGAVGGAAAGTGAEAAMHSDDRRAAASGTHEHRWAETGDRCMDCNTTRVV